MPMIQCQSHLQKTMLALFLSLLFLIFLFFYEIDKHKENYYLTQAIRNGDQDAMRECRIALALESNIYLAMR